ncbi:D-sedoheptulose 7-phosphate isomerase [Candidatus Woesearchaeota archaeon]|nr:D-sedoheptulose 7-phosphate isomerase [Candidatus Woesearchaeota archaeon]
MQETIGSMIKESGETNRLVQELSPQIGKAAVLLIDALKNNKKIILAGNGGSAEMSAHIAAEFVGRYKIERKALPAIALTTDLAAITAIGNDYGFDAVFERQLEALGKEGDVFIALTTSGNSKNLIRAAQKAKELNIDVIGLLGKDGGKMKSISKLDIIVPSYNTPRIQEAHLMILHIICELVEKELFG